MLARRRRTLAALFAIVALLSGGYLLAVTVTPLPAPQITLTVPHDEVIEADSSAAQTAVDAEELPTAVGWAHGDAVWSNDDASYPIASITKLVTVLVGLEAHPLAAGDAGPTYTWSAADQQITAEYVAVNGIVHSVAIGTEFTMREMLTLMLLPSSNNFAAAYANWVFGSNEAFVEAAAAFAKRHELTSLRITEPTGLSADNVATAADLLRLARIAVQNETLVELTSTQSAQLPGGIGTVINTNPLLSVMPGVIGLKTGSLSVVGYNLAVAQEIEVHGRALTHLAVVLARGSGTDRAAAASVMLERMSALPTEVTLVEVGEVVATATTAWGETTDLVTTNGVVTLLVPGEAALRVVNIGAGGTDQHGSADERGVAAQRGAADQGIPTDAEVGTIVGSLTVRAPNGSAQVPLVTTKTLTEPGFWWRVTHPGALFGWE